MDKQNPKNENANSGGAAGAGVGGGGGAKATKQRKKRFATEDHIKNFVREIRSAGLQLRSSDGDTQLAMLPKVLEYMGDRGANTYELVAAGYLRPSARIAQLQETYVIKSLREDCFGTDGLWHKGISRYFLIGKRKDLPEVPA